MSEQETRRRWSVLDQLPTMSNFCCAEEKKMSYLRDSNVLQNTLKVFILKCFSFNLTALRCFWLLFHGNVEHPDFKNNSCWFLPDPNTAPIVFVFRTNSKSKEACWAFKGQPRQPFKTLLSVQSALVPVALASTISKSDTTMWYLWCCHPPWRKASSCSPGGNPLLATDPAHPLHPIPAWTPTQCAILHSCSSFEPMFILELILWLFI